VSDILLVEDDTDFAAFVQLALARVGYHVTWARDGGEAEALLKTRMWALIITDMFMPVGDGFDVLRAVETHAPSAQVIAMSGGPRDNHRYDYLQALGKIHAIDATLYKPFPKSRLVEEVERLLSAPAALAA
jgi:DNA-binding response OmpR family regulator